MMRLALRCPDQARAQPDPVARAGLQCDRKGSVEPVAGLCGLRDLPFHPFAIERVKQGKEEVVADLLLAGRPKQLSGISGPGHFLGQQVKVPHPDAGSFDPEAETQVSGSIFRTRLEGIGHAFAFMVVRPGARSRECAERVVAFTICPKPAESSRVD